jgi:hypothetical protein
VTANGSSSIYVIPVVFQRSQNARGFRARLFEARWRDGVRLAWDRLSDGQREELRNLVAVHSHATSGEQIDPAHAGLRQLNRQRPRAALYIASHAAAIEGMDDARSRALLARLIDEATQGSHVYSHQ